VVVGAVDVGGGPLKPPDLFLKQATSYCEGAPAALYAFPPVPPAMLPNPGSLKTDPGELPDLPGVVSWPAEFAVFWQVWLGGPVPLGFPPPA